jgi:hypothetical protein
MNMRQNEAENFWFVVFDVMRQTGNTSYWVIVHGAEIDPLVKLIETWTNKHHTRVTVAEMGPYHSMMFRSVGRPVVMVGEFLDGIFGIKDVHRLEDVHLCTIAMLTTEMSIVIGETIEELKRRAFHLNTLQFVHASQKLYDVVTDSIEARDLRRKTLAAVVGKHTVRHNTESKSVDVSQLPTRRSIGVQFDGALVFEGDPRINMDSAETEHLVTELVTNIHNQIAMIEAPTGDEDGFAGPDCVVISLDDAKLVMGISAHRDWALEKLRGIKTERWPVSFGSPFPHKDADDARAKHIGWLYDVVKNQLTALGHGDLTVNVERDIVTAHYVVKVGAGQLTVSPVNVLQRDVEGVNEAVKSMCAVDL